MLKFKNSLFFLTIVFTILVASNYARAAKVENLLLNGEFEDGIITPWTTYGDVAKEVVKDLKKADVPENPIEGDFCLYIKVNSKGANFWNSGLQHAGHTFVKGKKYTLSAFLKAQKGTLQINFKPELGQDPWPGYGAKAFTMTDKWAEYSTTTPVFAENVNPATITFHIAYNVGEFWVDAVRFYEGDYVAPDFVKTKAVDPKDKITGTWGKIKTNL